VKSPNKALTRTWNSAKKRPQYRSGINLFRLGGSRRRYSTPVIANPSGGGPMETTPLNKIQRLVWLLLLASQAVYIAVALLHPGLGATDLAENPIFSVALALVAVVSGGMAHILWRRASGANLSLHEFSSRHPVQMFPLFIMAWSIDESIAIYGLVQALLGISIMIWLPFSLAGALLLMLHRPIEPPA
jgi:hypothetical protein